MARLGRPPVGDRISVRLPSAMIDELDGRAEAAGVTRAEAIRVLLDSALSSPADDGVDRTQIAQRLALTPAERISRMAEETRRMLALVGRAS